MSNRLIFVLHDLVLTFRFSLSHAFDQHEDETNRGNQQLMKLWMSVLPDAQTNREGGGERGRDGVAAV